MAKLTFKGKEGGDFELITPGVYEFMIVKAEITEDRDHNPQLHCEFEIVDGPETSKKIPQWFGTTDKRGWAIRNLCDATNTTYDIVEEGEGDNPPVLDMETDDLLQKYVRAELTHFKNQNTGKTYHNLGKFELSPLQAAAEGGSTKKPADAPASDAKPAEAAEAPKTAAAPKAASQIRRGTAPAAKG